MLEGKEINGYKFGRMLDRGSFDKVYEANKSGKEYAVKVISIDDSAEKEQHFANILSAHLICPYLVRYYDSFRDKGILFIVMELCSGGDLWMFINQLDVKKGMMLSTARVMKIVIQLLLAINCLHHHKIIHRNINLKSVFVDKDDNVKLGDFDCSLELEDTCDEADTYIGVPPYLAPEVYEHKKYRYEVDVWALGVIFYNLCMLKMPFPGDSVIVVMSKIIGGKYEPISSDMYPQDVCAMIHSMLTKDVKARPTGEDLLSLPVVLRFAKTLNLLPFFPSRLALLNSPSPSVAFSSKTISDPSSPAPSPIEPSLKPGDIIQGYEIGDEIGEGGFGKVYRCSKDGREYALKRMEASKMQDKSKKVLETEENFANRISVTLNSPFLVKYYNTFRWKGDVYVVMELCPKGDLRALINEFKELQKKNVIPNPMRLTHILIQILLGLETMHRNKLIHRDLKPDNIFIDEKDNVKIGDFGCSKELEFTSQEANSVIGTPLYECPEVIRGESYNSSADMWALGVMLYELCMLEQPFNDPQNNRYRLQQKIFSGKYKPVSRFRCPNEINKMISDMINLDAKKRPTALKLLQDPFIQESATSFDLLKYFPKEAMPITPPQPPSQPVPQPSVPSLTVTKSGGNTKSTNSKDSNDTNTVSNEVDQTDVTDFITEMLVDNPSISRAEFCKEFEEVFLHKATPKQVNLFLKAKNAKK